MNHNNHHKRHYVGSRNMWYFRFFRSFNLYQDSLGKYYELLQHSNRHIPLSEIGHEVSKSNSIQILKLRRFIRKYSTKNHSPELVTTLGTSLPTEIKLWLSIQETRKFIDRPRQCNKFYKFNHSTFKSNLNQNFTTCWIQNKESCWN